MLQRAVELGLYTGNDARVRLVLQAVQSTVTDPGSMRALGFCVSIDHAEFMARRFTEAGIPSRALTSHSSSEERSVALRDLDDRKVNVLFTVDLFNEGIDLPAIDTVLFLRPTESATVFLQQLGRGLRLSDNKPCLTVLDFIGAQHAEFRFDLRYRALTGVTRRGLIREAENGFPTLPAGCHIELDRVVTDLVLSNVRRALHIPWTSLAAELRAIGECTLGEFLIETGLELEDVYRSRRGGWTNLRRRAGLDTLPPGPDDDRLAGALGRMLSLDDPERLAFMTELVSAPDRGSLTLQTTRQKRLAAMLHFQLWGSNESPSLLEASVKRFFENPSRVEELRELGQVLFERIRRLTTPLDAAGVVPLHFHARYSRDEALAAFGMDNPGTVRQGVRWLETELADVFFVTLRKTEAHYSATTMYADRAITPELFQWESQSTTADNSPTGQRYVHHALGGSAVHLFLRETKEADGDLGAPPYLYAGPMTYIEHTGSRPMRVIWRLDRPLPADIFHAAKMTAG